MKLFNYIIVIFYSSYSITYSTTTMATIEDQRLPINIVSDNASIDNKNKISIYSGNVSITQGTTKLTGDKVTIYGNDKKTISLIISEADEGLAYYEENQENDKGIVKAWGKTIKYNLNTSTVHLEKHAKLEQKGDIFGGNIIEYDKKAQTVTAKRGNETGSQRVNMIIKSKE